MNEWQILALVLLVTNLGFVCICEMLTRQRDSWAKSAHEWKRIAVNAHAEVMYLRAVASANQITSGMVATSSSFDGLTSTQVSQRVH